jgi:hypothetical protein
VFLYLSELLRETTPRLLSDLCSDASYNHCPSLGFATSTIGRLRSGEAGNFVASWAPASAKAGRSMLQARY